MALTSTLDLREFFAFHGPEPSELTTPEQARRSGVRVSLLARWYDVDEPDDLDRLAADLGTTRGPGSHTRRYLATVRHREA